MPKIHFWREYFILGCIPTHYWVFSNISYPTTRSRVLKLFGNLWVKSYTKLIDPNLFWNILWIQLCPFLSLSIRLSFCLWCLYLRISHYFFLIYCLKLGFTNTKKWRNPFYEKNSQGSFSKLCLMTGIKKRVKVTVFYFYRKF